MSKYKFSSPLRHNTPDNPPHQIQYGEDHDSSVHDAPETSKTSIVESQITKTKSAIPKENKEITKEREEPIDVSDQTHVLISGCMNPGATNYNPEADINDESMCKFPIAQTIDLPGDLKEKKETTQNIIANISDTPAGTVLGGIFTDSEDYQTNYNQIVEFFDRSEEQVQPALQSILGDGYTVEEDYTYGRSVKEGGLEGIVNPNDVIKVTHVDTGEEVYINFGISTAGFGDRYDQTEESGKKLALEKGVYENEFNKLSEFINSTASKRDEKTFSLEVETMVSRYAGLNSTDGSYLGAGAQKVVIYSDDFKVENGKVVSGTQKVTYYGPMAVTPKEKKEIVKDINEGNWDVQTITSSGYTSPTTGITSGGGTRIVDTYKKEKKAAEKQLIDSGIQNPTNEAIIVQAKENLIKQRLSDLVDEKYTKFANSNAVEDSDLGSVLNVAQIYHKRIDIEEKKKIGGFQIKYESKITDLDAEINTDGTNINAFFTFQNAGENNFTEAGGGISTFEIAEGEDYYVLENGTRMPASLYDKAMLGKVEYAERLADIKISNINYLEQIQKVKADEVRANLVSRNYDDWDKFGARIYSTTKDILFNVDYALGGKTDNEMLDYRESAMQVRNNFQKDVSFENAFSSLSNLGKFISQETATQIPIFAMIATGWPGITALGVQGFGEQWGTMVEADTYDFLSPKTSTLNKILTSGGYGLAEVVFDRFLSYPVLKRSGQAMFGNNYAQLLRLDTKEYFKQYGKRQLLYDPLLETSSEVLTTGTQNLITGRPFTENMAHAAFSGGMFGTVFGHVPFYKGLIMNEFASPDMLKDYRSNIKTLGELEKSLNKLNAVLKTNTTKGNNTANIEGNIETVKQEQSNIIKENETIIEAEEKKVSNLDKVFFDTYNKNNVKQQLITIEAQRVNSSEDLSGNEKQVLLGGLLKTFNNLQATKDYLRDEKNFGKKFAGFKSSTDKKDVGRKEDIYKAAESELISEGKTEPKEKEIEQKAEIIYNTQEINNDFNKLQEFKELDESFQNFQTVEEAKAFINAREDLSDSDKARLIKNIEEGGHGSNVETTIGDMFSFQVVENMAKDNRLETETHEKGHYIWRMAFGKNPGSFDGIAEVAWDYVGRTNEKLLTLLSTRVETYEQGDVIPEGKEAYDRTSKELPTLKNMKSEELLMNFLELVAEGKIDLKSKKNKGLGAYFSWMINSSTKDALGENADLNFKGEDDAINFLITLGKKIKDGTITKEDIKDIKESKITEIVGEQNIEDASKTTTDADIKNSKAISTANLLEVQEDATIDGTFNKDKFDPSDKRITSELPGMVNAQISNLSINPFLTENGRQELMMETITGLLTKKDIDKFDGRGTLYGFTNGRIKFRILDAFRDNPTIVEDFSQVDLDETMKQLEAEAVDVTPLDEKITDETIASDAKINVLTLTNKADDIVKIVKPEGDYKTVIDNNVGEVGNKIFNIPANKISDPKANITTSTKIIDVNTGKPLSKQDLKEGKKGILEPSEAKNIQDFFGNTNTTKKFIKILPKENVTKKDADINKLGENIDVSRRTYGRAIGLPNRILEYFYNKKFKEDGKRARSQGLTSQVGIWELKPEFSNLSETELTKAAEQFQQDLGITEDGLTNVLPTKENRSKIGQLLKGAAVVISQQASLSAAQRVKEARLKKIKDKEAIVKVKQEIADITTGQADISFSKKNKKPVGEVVREAYIYKNGMLSEKRGIKLTPGSGKGRLKSTKFPKSNLTYGEEFDLGLNRFLENFPQYTSILRSTFGTYRGWYGNVGNFDKAIKTVADKDNQTHPPRRKYSKKGTKTFDSNFLKKIDNEFTKEQLGRLNVLYDFFKNVETHLDNNPDDVWVFEEMLRDGTNDMSSIIRILAPFQFYPVDINKNPIFNLEIVEEHTDPQNQVGKGLLFAAANGDVDAMWSAIGGSYMQGALLKTHDPEGALKAAMPSEYYEFTIPLLKSGKLKLPKGYASIIRLALSGPNNNSNVIDLNQYMLVGEQQTITEFFSVNTKADITPEVIALQNETIVKVLTGKTKMSNAKKEFNAKLKVQQITKVKAKAKIQNSKAINKARLTNENTKVQGISVLDFDDTLATSKSMIRYTKPDGTKGTLNAEQYASTYQELSDQGYEWDFSEFNKVVDGKTAPLFNKALKLQEKFGAKDMFVLTARPAEAAPAIFAFLQANGLNIPLENITGLANSTSEAKALWMAEKVGDGYNDFYFADDALQNVQAVQNMLDQFDVKSKVQQAKIKFSKDMKSTMDNILDGPQLTNVKSQSSMNDVKNVDRLSSDGVYSNIKFSKKHRGEYENLISKNRPDLVKEGLVTQSVDQMFDLVDRLDIPASKKRKHEQIMSKWLATSVMKLPEDNYKLQDAVKLAEKNNLDLFAYNNPNEIIEAFAGKAKAKPTNPDTIELFVKDESKTNDQYGITEYVVTEDKQNNEFWIDDGQQAVRNVVDTHWGPKSNPWCIIARDKDGTGTMQDAMENWDTYSDGPKRIVFQNGRLIAMYANGQYWDRMDNDTDAPVVIKKEGNVTEKVELVPTSKGKVDEFVMERRTVSSDKNTVTTEYIAETKDYETGTTVVENRVNGTTVKKTTSRPSFDRQGNDVMQVLEVVNYNKKGKATNNKNFEDGELIAINTYGRPFGEMMPEQIVKEKGDQIEFMGAEAGVKNYFAESLIADKVAEIGFKLGKNIKLESVIETSPNGEIRLDINKVLAVDANVKGLPSNIKFSKNLDLTINEILEKTNGIEAKKRFSDVQAKLKGKGFKFRGIIPASAQDFAGLLYNFLSKGKEGERQFEILKKALIDPFARGIDELNTSRQNASEDYRALLKEFPEVKKDLNEKINSFDNGSFGDLEFTVDQAVRVYLFNKAGFEVPGLSARDLKSLVDFIESDGELQAFADTLSVISKKEDGYAKPGEYWLTETIASDLTSDGAIGDARADFLAEWKQNADQIFSKENLNKIEVTYGAKFREALQDVLYRMETGRNRPSGGNRLLNGYMNWVNGSVGAIMFFNIRSAVLQTISATNYINWSDNNPLKAAAAFANQKQFWADFSMIFNSSYLQQRRSGNKRGVNEADLSAAVTGVGAFEQTKAAIRYLLKIGFLPTQIADSFAIASGGASFYRNRVKSLMKKGTSRADAESQAFLDFQETTEVSQQSARPDMISQQQANPLGRLLLAFQNTPMQYGRIMNKAFRDIANGRGDTKTHVSKIIYYGVVQSIIFTALQSALFAVAGSDDDDEKKEMIDKKSERMMNSMVDTWLTSLGYGGKAISTVKNTIMEFDKQRDKDVDDNFMSKSDHAYTLLQALSFAPPIGAKLRKIYQSIQTEKFNRDLMKERGLTLDNPAWSMIGNVIEGATNVPLGRLAKKMLNIDNAMDSSNEVWQRVALMLGWSTWDLGIKDPDLVSLGGDIKEAKKKRKAKETEIKKEEKKRVKLKEKYPNKTEKEIDIAVKSKELFNLSKRTQIDILKELKLSDKEIKKLKKEQDRTDKIAELYEKNSELIEKTIKESKNKPKEEKTKKKEVVLSKLDIQTKKIKKLKKQDQVNLLLELGYSPRKINSLKYEKDRVEVIIKLQNKKSK